MNERQSRMDSAMETVTNTAIGFAVAMIGNAIILPLLFGIELSGAMNVITALCYTGISIVRQFTIRRLFNGRSVWSALKFGWSVRWHAINGSAWVYVWRAFIATRMQK